MSTSIFLTRLETLSNINNGFFKRIEKLQEEIPSLRVQMDKKSYVQLNLDILAIIDTAGKITAQLDTITLEEAKPLQDSIETKLKKFEENFATLKPDTEEFKLAAAPTPAVKAAVAAAAPAPEQRYYPFTLVQNSVSGLLSRFSWRSAPAAALPQTNPVIEPPKLAGQSGSKVNTDADRRHFPL